MSGERQLLYNKLYCARCDMEKRIKEQQLDLFADRISYQIKSYLTDNFSYAKYFEIDVN